MLKIFIPFKSSRRHNDSPSVLRKSDAHWKLSSNCTKSRKANRNFIYLKINMIVVEKQQEIKKKKQKGPPLRAEVHKLRGELASRKLR